MGEVPEATGFAKMKDCLQGREDVKTMNGALVNLPRAMQHFLMKRSVCKVGYKLHEFTDG